MTYPDQSLNDAFDQSENYELMRDRPLLLPPDSSPYAAIYMASCRWGRAARGSQSVKGLMGAHHAIYAGCHAKSIGPPKRPSQFADRIRYDKELTATSRDN